MSLQPLVTFKNRPIVVRINIDNFGKGSSGEGRLVKISAAKTQASEGINTFSQTKAVWPLPQKKKQKAAAVVGLW